LALILPICKSNCFLYLFSAYSLYSPNTLLGCCSLTPCPGWH